MARRGSGSRRRSSSDSDTALVSTSWGCVRATGLRARSWRRDRVSQAAAKTPATSRAPAASPALSHSVLVVPPPGVSAAPPAGRERMQRQRGPGDDRAVRTARRASRNSAATAPSSSSARATASTRCSSVSGGRVSTDSPPSVWRPGHSSQTIVATTAAATTRSAA